MTYVPPGGQQGQLYLYLLRIDPDVRIDLSLAETCTFIPVMAFVHLIIPFSDNRQLTVLSLSLSLTHLCSSRSGVAQSDAELPNERCAVPSYRPLK